MKLTLKIAVALAVIVTAVAAYAEVPDVSKWSCEAKLVYPNPDYGSEVMACDSNGPRSFYMKISGELVYIHEHRNDGDKTVYYNALKTNEGNWIEAVNKSDLIFESGNAENGGILMLLFDDNDNVVAERLVPLLKK